METRRVLVGGLDREALLSALSEAGVALNAHGHTLLAGDDFGCVAPMQTADVVEVRVAALGLLEGATTAQLYEAASRAELSLCPRSWAPYLRLQSLDQPEGAVGFAVTQHRAPPGSITVASQWPEGDGPKGFYLRRIEGTLWLRGYDCDEAHVWHPDDVFLFQRAADDCP